MTRPDARAPWVVWGGLLPSGSLKYLTFQSYLALLGSAERARGLIEISEGCTALALQYFAERDGTPLLVLCSPAGKSQLLERGYRAGVIVVHSLQEALELCAARQREGWHWPEQMSNPRLIDAAQTWAPALAKLLSRQPEIDIVACGFGTGATVISLTRALAPHGYRVIGIEAPAGASVAGWRNYAAQNLGAHDLFAIHGHGVELQTPHPASTQSPTPLQILLSHDYGVGPERVCIVSHDGTPG